MIWHDFLLSLYKYFPEYGSGILWYDKDLAIDWVMMGINQIILSEKIRYCRLFRSLKLFIVTLIFAIGCYYSFLKILNYASLRSLKIEAQTIRETSSMRFINAHIMIAFSLTRNNHFVWHLLHLMHEHLLLAVQWYLPRFFFPCSSLNDTVFSSWGY